MNEGGRERLVGAHRILLILSSGVTTNGAHNTISSEGLNQGRLHAKESL